MSEDILYRLRTYYPEHPVCIAAADYIAALREDAEKYHTQLIECKNNWSKMKQQRDELLAAIFKYQKSAEECNTADGFGMWAAIQDWEDFSEAIAKAGGE